MNYNSVPSNSSLAFLPIFTFLPDMFLQNLLFLFFNSFQDHYQKSTTGTYTQ